MPQAKSRRQELTALRPHVAELERELAKTKQQLIAYQNTTSCLQADETLKLYKYALESSSDAIGLADGNGKHLYQNTAFARLFECDRPEDFYAAGGMPARFVNQEIADDMLQSIINGKSWAGEVEMLSCKGRRFQAWARANAIRDESGRVLGLIKTISDISARKQAEMALQASEAQLREQTQNLEQTLHELQWTQSQLIQSEKMSSLGQLVAGVAHEINNPVSFIYGNLIHANEYTQDLVELIELYQKHYPQPVAEIAAQAEAIDLEFLLEDLPKLLSSMKVGADRIQQIVLSLRTFSHIDEAQIKEVNIHEGIDSTLTILQNRLKPKPNCPGIELIKDYGNLPLVECYAGQLNQVFMNILCNAIDALEEGHKSRVMGHGPESQSPIPTIRIRTQLIQPNQVIIQIADNGPGMTETVRKRLFDPFFTTKPVGKGTGMGLSISYQIITERHRGSLQCISSPGQGAEFRIQIPLKQ